MKAKEILFAGDLQIPVIVIDNFERRPQNLVELAAENAAFSPERASYYPGERANLPERYVRSCLRSLVPLFYELYKIDKKLKPKVNDAAYSLITKQAHELEPVQTVPHFDSANPNMIATVHYLNEGEHGGIGLFRHRATEYDYVDESRKEIFFSRLNSYLASEDRYQGYCKPSHEEFECYLRIDYKPNRLIAFPGYLLHSVLVNEKTDIDLNPRTGRLTANVFMEFQAE